MRKKLRVAIGILSLVAVAFTIISFIFRLNEIKASGELASGAEYSILRNAVASTATKEDFQDRFIRDRLLALYEGSTRLLAAQVLDENGLSVWKIPAESKYFALPNQKGGRAGFSSPQWSTVVFTTPLSGNMRLAALYASVFTSEISNAAKLPAFFIGGWFLIVLFLSFFLTKDTKEGLLPEPIDTKAAERQGREPSPEMAQTQEGLIEIPSIDKTSGSGIQALSTQEKESIASEVDKPNTLEMQGLEHETEISPELLAAYGLPPDALEPLEITIDANAEPLPESKPEHEKQAEPPKDSVYASNVQPAKNTSQQGALQGPLSKSGNFEESLQKFEEEIVLWSSRQKPTEAAQPASLESQALKQSAIQHEIHTEEAFTSNDEGSETQELPEGLDQEIEETLEELETKDSELLNHDESEIESNKNIEKIPEILTSTEAEKKSQEQEKRDITTLPMPLSISEPNLENLLNDELLHGIERETSLMLIHCELSGPQDPSANALFATIRDYFVAKELMFELYKGGFAVVMPGMDLGSSLKMSEDLADVLAATMNLYKDLDGEPPVFIGISSTGARAVDAQKLYREASTALHKAYSGSPWHILAFRPKIA